MRYYKSNGAYVVEVPAKDIMVRLVDRRKKTAYAKDFVNAGFFAPYAQGTARFTLPVGHMRGAFEAEGTWTKYYCKERGSFSGATFTYAQPGKTQTTFYVSHGKAGIADVTAPPSGCSCAIAGLPILRNGRTVTWGTAKTQGWDTSCLRATWHIFVGLKADRSMVYLICAKTTSANLMSSGEGAALMCKLGMTDAIKLDGGGSTVMNVSGKNVVATAENRRICTILTFGEANGTAGNPYAAPIRALLRGCKGNDVKWLQWELKSRGYKLDVDGSFGPATGRALKDYQSKHGLAVDGSCGPATRAALKSGVK